MSARRLLDACASGDKAEVLELISGGCDPQRTCNEVGKTPLHIACLNGHFDIVLLLLHAHHCNANRKDYNRRTPLHDACLGGHVNVTHLLLSTDGINNYAKDNLGETLLHKACQSGNLVLIRYLVDYFMHKNVPYKLNLYEDDSDVYDSIRGIDPNSFRELGFLLTPNCDGDTAFDVACRLGHTSIIRYVSKNPLLYPNCAKSLLQTACQCGHFGIVKYLVNNDDIDSDDDSDIDDDSDRGNVLRWRKHGNVPPAIVGCDTPLLIASRCGNYNITEYMYMREQQFSTPMNRSSDTAVHAACVCDSLDIVKLLVKSNNCEQQDDYGDTPLHVACAYGSVKSATFLLNELNCNPSVCNKNGETPLHLACMHCKLDISTCRLLLNDERCDVMICNSNKETPLHIASCHDCPELIQLILERCGFGQDLADCYGDTPLFNACRSRSIATVRLLTQSCCYPLHINKYTHEMPVHIACRMQQLDILQVLLEQYGGKIDQRNGFGETPLHIACNEDAIEIVQFLLQRNLCDLNVQNKWGYTAMHIACMRNQTDILECLLKEEDIKFEQRNEDGDTILHLACYKNTLDIVKLVLKCTNMCTFIRNNDGNTPVHIACQRKGCNVLMCILENHSECLDEHVNSQGETPLHVACTSGALDIVQFLYQNKYCDPCVQNEEGNTALHCACMNGNTDIVKYLLTHTIINPSLSNHSGNTPLHCACEEGLTEIAEYLLTNSNCDQTLCNIKGAPPLISAFLLRHYNLLMLLINKNLCDLTVSTQNGTTILNCACQEGNIDLVRLLLSVDSSNILINLKGSCGNTPLHSACVSLRCEEVLQILLSNEHCDPMLTDNHGNTPLHIACAFNEYRAAKILLSNEKVDLCVKNANGKTPIQLAQNYSIMKLLIGHGANPNDVYEHYGTILDDFRQRQPLHPSVKILVLGNSSMGKTTLIEALKTENSDPQSEIPQVQAPTVGIERSEHRSEHFGKVLFYDFAGQAEYYSSHSVFLEFAISSSPPVLILLVSVESSSNEIICQLQYWFAFLENHCYTTDTKAHVIIIGSHCDTVSPAESSQKLAALNRWLAKKASVLKHFGPILLDCRKPGTDDMTKLRGLLEESCSSLRVCVELDCRCHVLFAYLLERFPGTLAITVCDLSRHIRKNRTQSPRHPADAELPLPFVLSELLGALSGHTQRCHVDPFGIQSDLFGRSYMYQKSEMDLPLPYVLSELFKLLTTLSKSGHILLLKDAVQDENSWIILDQDSLYRQVNGVIFAPKDFEQHHHLASNAGVMPSSKLTGVFPNLNLDMVKTFLVYSELAQKIEDVETLTLIGENKEAAAIDPSDMDEYYFFPGLVSVEKPLSAWDQSSKDFSYQCGWYIQCKPEQLLTNRFLHVLLLRLVFSFAAASDSENETPSLNRRCSIWKNGIKWSNRDGVEVLIEVTEQSTVVLLLIRCFKGQEMKCVKLRSAVISKILDAKQQFSPQAKVNECFIHPSEIGKYPNMNIETVSKVNICEIAKAINEGSLFVLNQRNQAVRLEDLLHFEPYEGIGRDHLNPLYLPEKAKEKVPTSFLYEVSKHCQSKCEKFAEILRVPSSDIATYKELHAERPDILLLHVLEQSWRDSRSETGTYGELRERFDHYSIWCNRNPFVSVCVYNMLVHVH